MKIKADRPPQDAVFTVTLTAEELAALTNAVANCSGEQAKSQRIYPMYTLLSNTCLDYGVPFTTWPQE